MERLRDYASFAAWFCGLGYFVFWLIPARAENALPQGFHAAGMVAAVFVVMRLAGLALDRLKAKKPHAASQDTLALETALPRLRDMQPRPRVKPRRHFGLRGAPLNPAPRSGIVAPDQREPTPT
jgi:hypothetical protein